MVRRGGEVLAPRPRWLRPVVRRALEAYPRPPADRSRELASYIELTLESASRDGAARACAGATSRRRWARRGGRSPRIATPGELADLLELDAGGAHVARGRPRARARHAPPPPAQLHLPLAAAPGRAAAADRATEGAVEGDPALDPPRDPRPHPRSTTPPTASSPGRSVPDPCGAARRPGDRRAARPRGLLRERPRGTRVRHLPDRRVPRGRRARADRAVRHGGPRDGVGADPAAERSAPGAPPRPSRAPPRDAPPPPGRARPRPPWRRSPPRPGSPARRAGADALRRLLALRRRPGRSPAMPTSPAGTLARGGRGGRARRGFRVAPGKTRRPAPQRAPARLRRRGQRAPQRPARRVRPPQGGPARRGATRPGGRKPRRPRRLPRAPAGRIAWVGQLHPARGERLQARFDAIAW